METLRRGRTLTSPPSPSPPEESRLRFSKRDVRRLRSISGNRNSLPSQVRSARVLLKSGQGVSETEIAKELDMAPELVRDSIQRFARSRFVSLEKTLLPALQLHVRDNGQAVPIHLVGSERRRLQTIAAAQTSSQRDALRAKVILQANLGLNNCEIADQLGTDVKTVRKWRGRYNQMGLEGLHDERRAGRPLQFGAAVRQEVFTAVVLEPPDPYAAWTLDLLVKHLVLKELVETISVETVSYWLRTADIKPHRVRGWLNSKDPNFREKRDRINDLYRNPPRDGELLSVDEKTSIRARERIRVDHPVGIGVARKHEFEYIRHGVVHLLACFNVRNGQIDYEIPAGKNDSVAFISFLKKLMKVYPRRKLYLILDNGTTHCSRPTRAFFTRHPRLVPVFTPTHASWLNQIEIWFSVLQRQALTRVSFSGREHLITRLQGYIEVHNRELAHPYEWSSKGKVLMGISAKERRRNRSILPVGRQAARC